MDLLAKKPANVPIRRPQKFWHLLMKEANNDEVLAIRELKKLVLNDDCDSRIKLDAIKLWLSYQFGNPTNSVAIDATIEKREKWDPTRYTVEELETLQRLTAKGMESTAEEIIDGNLVEST